MYPTTVQLNEANISKLTKLYQTAYAQIFAELEGATSFGIANRRALLSQIEAILVQLGSKVNPLLKEEVEKYYKLGQTDADKQLKHVKADVPISGEFNKINQDAVLSLVDDTQRAFAESIQGVNRSAQHVISNAVKQQITEKIATGKVSGLALRTIKNSVTGVLKNEGLAAIVDKGGRKWELDRYAEMLIRTKAVEARNRGLANRMAENEYDLVQVSAHGATDVCAQWEGKILSTTGNTAGYPTVAQAESSGLFHPNCRHAINVLVPELAKITHAYNPNIDTLTGEEFIDEVDVKFKGLVAPVEQKVAPKRRVQ